jgi:UDP-N-acetylmuramate: L-alanyl-gamma-D-glutamyl-meso-diaminopimelate ligase
MTPASWSMAASKLHFLGIAGSTMAGIAAAMVKRGYSVTGTDPGAYPPTTDWLDAQGITWWRQPDATHLDGVDTVVMSGGTPLDDVELVAAQERGLPVKSYAEFVGELVADKHQIVVAGTHGKTTTTALIAWLLEAAGRRPDFLVGIQPHNFDTSVRLGDSAVVVLEGDEYKASSIDERSKFSYYRPATLVLTALEMDHPDLFKDIGEIRRRFRELVGALPANGWLLAADDAPELKTVAEAAPCPAESYGEAGDWQATGLRFEPTGLAFDVQHVGQPVGHFAVPLYGRHNVMNATAAIAAALGEGLTATEIQTGLRGFLGAARRFAIVSAPHAKVTVVDDYAHHPTEIATTIEAAKLHFGGRVIAVVRPHTYSRVQELLPQFRTAVATADLAFITDIEAAREKPAAATVSAEDISRDQGDQVVFEPDRAQLIQRVVAAAQSGDVVLSMTVSGYDGLAAELAQKLAN